MPKVRICCFIPNRFIKMVNKQPFNHHIEDQKDVSDSKTVIICSLISYFKYILLAFGKKFGNNKRTFKPTFSTTYHLKRILKFLLPLHRRRITITIKLHPSPIIPTIKIITPSNQNLVFSRKHLYSSIHS